MTNAGEGWRLFVAFELPDHVLDVLARLQEDLRQRGLTSLRWVQPAGIHLTLKFLGQTPVERLQGIEEALRAAVTGHQAVTLRLANLGSFGDSRGARVIWVDLAGDVALVASMREKLEGALQTLGLAKDARPFAPHLTLARVRPEDMRRLREQIAKALAETKVEGETFTLQRLSLIRSVLGPGGAVYTPVTAAPLA